MRRLRPILLCRYCKDFENRFSNEGLSLCATIALESKRVIFLLQIQHVHVREHELHRGTQRRFSVKYTENSFYAIQSTFRSPEGHSKRCYRICNCSVILGELEYFRKLQGLQCYFSQNFRCNLTIYESKFFLNPLSISFESENFRFPFSTKIIPTWGIEYEKLNFRKS